MLSLQPTATTHSRNLPNVPQNTQLTPWAVIMVRNTATQTATLRDVYRPLFRHRRKALLFFLAVMTATTLWTFLCPKTYRSEAKVLVRLGRENVALDPVTTLGHEQMVSVPSSRESEINSVVEELNSRYLIEKVVDAVGPETILDPTASGSASESAAGPEKTATDQALAQLASWTTRAGDACRGGPLDARERAVIALERGVEVAPVQNSNVIRIAYDARDPRASQAVTAKFIELFQEQHIQLNRTKGAYDFLAEQTAHLRSSLTRNEEELRQLKDATGLTSPEDQKRILVTRIGDIQSEWLGTVARTVAAQAAVNDVRAKLAGLPETRVVDVTAGFSNEGTDGMRQRFYQLQLEAEDAHARYTPDHPKMQEILDELAAAKAILEQEKPIRTHTTTAPDSIHQAAQLVLLEQEPALASLESKSDVLRTQLADVRRELKTFNRDEMRIARLQREIALQEADYREYSRNLEEARIEQALETERMSNISIVQPASYSAKPVLPRTLLNLAIGLVVGLLGGVGLAFSLDYLDRSFTTPEDVERRLGVPTLVSIPRLRRRELAVNGRN